MRGCIFRIVIAAVYLLLTASGELSAAPIPGSTTFSQLYSPRLNDTHMVNSLWIETPKDRQFTTRRTVTIADIKGPGVITMIHFAMPATLHLGREVVLRIYWDNEKHPSVEAPLVDFFCDPNGQLDRVNTIFLNKNRGWNCYFPMPFRRRALITLTNDAPDPVGQGLWQLSPCYAYVIWHNAPNLPKDVLYFCAHWRQQTLLLGKQDYIALHAAGAGRFIGWNVTVRGVAPGDMGYPVDENEKFYVDGARNPTIQFMGLEDSFGFSWGFPEKASRFLYTGWHPYYQGASAYRFFVNDAITFHKSLKVAIGFGPRDDPSFRRIFSRSDHVLQFSSCCYWYQTEPHLPWGKFPLLAERRPARDLAQQAQWEKKAKKYRDKHETLVVNCGAPNDMIEFADNGWSCMLSHGYSYNGFQREVTHCWADYHNLKVTIACPKNVQGVLRLYLLDGDRFMGGRKERIWVDGRDIGDFSNFYEGRWVEIPITPAETTRGRIYIRAQNLIPGNNAVISSIIFQAQGR
ncbi:MAG: DUF2961 domain-containing protein [Armatimonadetes bacterium]|nr:DUF2961 domain-containing protein [Armatimonadota bacterium]